MCFIFQMSLVGSLGTRLVGEVLVTSCAIVHVFFTGDIFEVLDGRLVSCPVAGLYACVARLQNFGSLEWGT